MKRTTKTAHPGERAVRTRLLVAVMAITLVVTGLAVPPAAAATPPANDAFAAATVLDGALPITVAGTNVDATSEPGEPLDGAMTGSVWYRWTAPSAARVFIQACSTTFNPRLGVYVGPTVDSQVLVQEGPPPFDHPCGHRTSVSFVPTPGTTYNLSVRAYFGEGGAFDLTVRPPAATNDDFAAAEVLPGAVPSSTSAFTEEATRELGEPSHAGDAGARSIWYAWTPAASGEVAVSTCGSDFDTLLAVYTGTEVDELLVVAANDDDPDHCGTGRQSRLVFDAVAGTTYMIAVDGWGGSFGNVALSITAPHPANDDLGAAEVLAGTLPIAVTGSNVSATTEDGEPDPPGPSSGASVWFDWTPEASALVSVTSCDSTFQTSVAVFVGDDVSALTNVGGGHSRCGGYGGATFAATAGATYHVRVAGAGGTAGSVALRIALADPPANDAFEDATVLSGALPITVDGTDVDATHEEGEPAVNPAFTASAWFAWTPDESTLVQVQTCGGEGEGVLAVYTGPSLDALQPIALNEFGCFSGSSVTIAADAATTYWIAVDGFAEGTFPLTISPALRPVNDDFADAVTLTGTLPVAVDGTNVAATSEDGEPRHADLDGGTSVWYRWTPDESTQVTLDTCGSDFDTMLAVYTGSALSDLEVVRSNDDRCGRRSEVVFPAIAGTTYWIVVDGWNGAQGSFHLSLVESNRPANDDFDNAEVLTGAPPIERVTGTNVEATLEPGEPQHGIGVGSTVWYRYTPEASGVYQFASCASPIPLDIDIYTGNRVFALTLVPSRPAEFDCGSDQVVAELTAGTTYSISVDGRYATDAFRFGVFLSEPPANDDFADAQVLDGPLPITVSGNTSGATTEPGEPHHSGDPADGASVWYRWTPTETMWVAVDGGPICHDGSQQQYAVYTGSAVDALTPIPGRGCADGTIHFEAAAGTTYHIVEQADLGEAIDFELTIRALDRPANDDLSDAQAVHGPLPRAVEGDLLDGTLEPDEPRASLPFRLSTVWYDWTAPVTGPITIETCGSEFITHIGVFTGTATDDLTRVASENHACGLNGSATFQATRGTTYRVQIAGTWFHRGPIRVTFRAPVRPANDTFAGARTLDGADPIVVRDSNIDATREAGEPLHAGEGGGSSLWYRWTAPTTGEYRIDTCDSGVFGTQLAVYTGSLIGALTTIAADNDDCPSNRHGEVTFVATAGTTYVLAVDSEEGEQGWIELHIRRSRRAANDDFANVVVLTGSLPITVAGSSLDATGETGEPRNYNSRYDTNASAVWYRWTAPATAVVSVESCGSGFDSLVGVFRGNAVNALTPVHGLDSDCNNGRRAAFLAVAGTTYQIAVDGYFFATYVSTGPFQLTIRPYEPPANDDLTDAVVLDGTLPISIAGDNHDANVQDGEPQNPFRTEARATVWYSWTADDDGPTVLDICGATFDAFLGVWTGSSVDELVIPEGELEGFPDASCHQRHLEFEAQAGTTYRISVGGRRGEQGDFTLEIRRPNRPANDDFENATTVGGTLPAVVTADVTDASPQRPLEPVWATSVWYRWTATTTRPVVIDGCNVDGPAEIHVYTGEHIDALEPAGERVNGCVMSWTLTPTRGTTYWISLADFELIDVLEPGMQQTFQIRELDPPANDDFRQAEVIPPSGARPLTIVGDSTDATTERGEPRHAGGSPTGSVWYRYTPTRSGVVTVDTCGGTAFGSGEVLAVYTGNAMNQLVRVTDGGTGGAGVCGGGSLIHGGVKVAFPARAGTTYLIAYDGNDGPFHLTVQ